MVQRSNTAQQARRLAISIRQELRLIVPMQQTRRLIIDDVIIDDVNIDDMIIDDTLIDDVIICRRAALEALLTRQDSDGLPPCSSVIPAL